MTPAQCRAARSLLNWDQKDLFEKAGLASYMPVSYFERYGDNQHETLLGPRRHVSKAAVEKMMAAFEKAGIEFIEDTGVDVKRKVVDEK